MLVFSDPSTDDDHPLATGWNVEENAANQVRGVGDHSPRYLILEDTDKHAFNEEFTEDAAYRGSTE